MPDEARLLATFALALTATFAATPVAIAVATRTGFQDQPFGHKGHTTPTPYLGGAAVVAGFLLAALVLGGEFSRLAPIPLMAAAIWALGTIDDKLNLPMAPRVFAEAAAASGLWMLDLGWSVFDWELANLLLTNLWVVGLVNAFNLMDNMDGATATVGSVTSLATAVLALSQGDQALAALCFALAGACLGFLPYNLAGPARIFLGDGGSLPIGLVAAATIMALSHGEGGGWPPLLAAMILAGLPVVDTMLVMISRRRSGVPVLRGGRDHLTHRLLPRLETPRQVAVALALLQAGLGAFAIGVVQLGEGELIVAWLVWFVAVAFSVALLETEAWVPVREGVEQRAGVGRRAAGGLPRPTRTLVEATLVAFIAFACGASPFLNGFYEPTVWGPVSLLLLAALFGLIVARPAAPRTSALVASSALVGIWLWSLASIWWAESAAQALTDANRWLFYVALFGTLVLLLRNDKLARVLIASLTAAVLCLALYLVGAMLIGGPGDLFSATRLTEPVGYINGQAGYLLLGVWPLLALAVHAGRHSVAAGAMAGAALLGGLVLMTQSRGAALAAALTALALVAFLPARTRRLWGFVVAAAAVLAMAPSLTEVYDSGAGSGVPDAGTLRVGVGVVVLASLAGGIAWWLALDLTERFARRSPAAALSLRRASLGGLAALGCAGLVALAVTVNDPVGKLDRQVDSFVSLEGEQPGSGRTRLVSTGGNRYDYWRIAVKEWKSAPVAGLGAGNYQRDYFVERKTLEDVTQPHSLPFQLLAELGLVGVAGLLLFLGAVLAGARRRLREARGHPAALALLAAALGVFLSWFIHTSVDWLHVIPGITGVALAGAAVLVAPWARERAEWGRRHALLVVACALAVVLGGVMVGRWALADRYTGQAEAAVAGDPRRAIERSEAALDLNDESLRTYYVRAAAYARLDDYERARAELLEATRREPSDHVPWTLLGDLAYNRGKLESSRDYYLEAWRRNPRDTYLESLAYDPRFGTAEALPPGTIIESLPGG